MTYICDKKSFNLFLLPNPNKDGSQNSTFKYQLYWHFFSFILCWHIFHFILSYKLKCQYFAWVLQKNSKDMCHFRQPRLGNIIAMWETGWESFFIVQQTEHFFYPDGWRILQNGIKCFCKNFWLFHVFIFQENCSVTQILILERHKLRLHLLQLQYKQSVDCRLT